MLPGWPAPPQLQKISSSEAIPKRKLHNARCCRGSRSAALDLRRQTAEVGAVHCPRGRSEHHAVRKVEGFRAELDGISFANLEIPGEREIDVHHIGTRNGER